MPSDCPSRHPDGTPCQEQHPDHTLHHAHPKGVANCLRWADPGDTTTRIPATCQWLLVDQVEAGVVKLTAKAEARRAERVAAAFQEGRLDGRAPKAHLRRLRGADRMTKPAIPTSPAGQWPRIAVDQAPDGPFAELLRTATGVADHWTFGPDGPYKTPQSAADTTHGQIREALLHLLELGFIDIDVERMNAAGYIPMRRRDA